MRARTTILIAALSAAIPLHEAAHAQLSPQGVLGGITRPFRQMLGHLGHYPRSHRHRNASAEPQAAAEASPNEPSSAAISRPGWVGPPVWPSAFEDILGFALWADEYAPRLRGRGFDVIADTISGRFESPRPTARTATTGAAVSDAPEGSVTRCDDTSRIQDNWPAKRVEQILQLSDTQHDALEKLQAAANQSAKTISGNCGVPAALAPTDRLRTLVQTIWIVRDAGVSMRGPLNTFYASLTNTQKDSFVRYQQQNNIPADTKTAGSDANKQYQTCAAQNVEKAERLVQEVEMRVRPNRKQAESLENLHKVSTDMAKLLIASCAQPIPVDPLGRLDSADDQLTALNYAATTVQIAFDDFYARLDNSQKARFGSLSR